MLYVEAGGGKQHERYILYPPPPSFRPSCATRNISRFHNRNLLHLHTISFVVVVAFSFIWFFCSLYTYIPMQCAVLTYTIYIKYININYIYVCGLRERTLGVLHHRTLRILNKSIKKKYRNKSLLIIIIT